MQQKLTDTSRQLVNVISDPEIVILEGLNNLSV